MKIINFKKMTARQLLVLFSILLSVMAVYIYWNFVTFNKLFLFKDIGSDTINAFYPRLVNLANYLRSTGLPGWSFNRGMGQSIFPMSLGNPFEWPLFALGAKHLAYGIAYMEILKIIVGGMLFYLYLRLLTENAYICTVGGLLYAFSAVMILGGTWYNFSTQAVTFALMLYAVELYMQRGKWWLIPLSVALIASSFSFNLYTHAVFFSIYSLVRYLDLYGWKPRAMAGFYIKVIGLGMLGAGISAIFLIANIEEMLQSQRVSGEGSLVSQLMAKPVLSFAAKEVNIAAVMRAFSSNIIGIGSHYRGATNYLEDPMFYCGVITLLLAPQFFTFLDRRRRILYGALALIVMLPVLLPYFRYAFWLFSGDYYRILSLFIAVVVMFFALRALGNIISTGRINGWLLVLTSVVLLVALLYPYQLPGHKGVLLVDSTLKWITAGLICIYAVLLIGLARGETRYYSAIILVLILCGELVMTASMTVDDRPVIGAQEFKEKQGYKDYSVDAIAMLKKQDKGFYRIEKSYHSGSSFYKSLNDAEVQNYWGTASYSSFNEGSYLDFLDAMGMFSKQDDLEGRRWIKGLNQHPFLLSLASVKYLLIKDPARLRQAMSFGFRELGKLGDVYITLNPFALPMGFTYDAYIPYSDLMRLKGTKKEIALFKAVVLQDKSQNDLKEHLSRFDDVDIAGNYSIRDYVFDIRQRTQRYLKIDKFGQNEVDGKISLEQGRLLFFSIPYDKGWHLIVDGKPRKLLRVNVGFMGVMLAAGEHTVSLRYQQPYFWVGLFISLLALVIYIGAVFFKSRGADRQILKESRQNMGFTGV